MTSFSQAKKKKQKYSCEIKHINTLIKLGMILLWLRIKKKLTKQIFT